MNLQIAEVKNLAVHKIEELILETIGIKTTIKKVDNKLFLRCLNYNSCFEVMRKLRWDFDFSVHKKGKIYIIEI